jgi:hypothetical protein
MRNFGPRTFWIYCDATIRPTDDSPHNDSLHFTEDSSHLSDDLPVLILNIFKKLNWIKKYLWFGYFCIILYNFKT